MLVFTKNINTNISQLPININIFFKYLKSDFYTLDNSINAKKHDDEGILTV